MRPSARTESHRNALALMPELGDSGPVVRTARHVAVRVAASLAALTLVIGVVATGLAVTLRSTDQFTHQDVPVSALPPAESTQFTAWREVGPRNALAPVVLTYHDIQPEPVRSPYVVTPDAFERQMAMMKEAGYRSLTAAQFLSYRRGTYTPPTRSFLLTFDDGTAGLWRYADSVLTRYGFTAVSFVITGRVGTNKPYYLTWDLIAQMHASGRWDFESHTAALHTRVPTTPGGPLGGALSHRIVVNGRLENQSQFETRIRRDLQQSITDLTSHGLPRPVLFAYPFSDVVAKGVAGQEAALPRSIVSELFPVAFVDVEPGALPASRREVGKQVIGRAEVFHRDDEMSVFRRLQAMATLPVSALDPLRVDTHWLEDGGATQAPVEVVGDGLVADALTETFVAAEWAPQRTSDWVGYTVGCEVTGLLSDGRNKAGLTVRVGSGAEVELAVSQHSLQVTSAGRPVGSTIGLPPASEHRLEITVRGTSTAVVVDGTIRLVLPSVAGPATTGGFGVTFARVALGDDFPVLAALRVVPAA